jgi:hypothetical protein
VDDIGLGNEVSKTEPCLSLSNVPSSEVEECLTLSVHWMIYIDIMINTNMMINEEFELY